MGDDVSKILIIEDNKDVNALIKETLEDNSYEADSAFDGLNGLKMAKNGEYNLILLDIMLPYKSGDEILKEIRTCSDVPVIILSAKDMIGTKIDLLKLGADDYITKPFDLGELCARVESNLRRASKTVREQNVLQYKNAVLDVDNKTVTVNGEALVLTAKEYMIMELLMKNQGKVFSKSNIYESIWNEEYLGDDNAVKTHMSNLRNKIKKADSEEEYIETVWGLGYRLKKQ